MRRVGRVVLVGRNEGVPASVADRILHELAMTQAARAEPIFRWRWPDRAKRWDNWQVIALSGVTVNDPVRLLVYDGFATAPFPTLVGGIAYQPGWMIADPFESGQIDPPILHASWELFGPGDVDDGNHGEQAGFTERLRTLSRQLDKKGLLRHPLSGSRQSWERLLAIRRLKVDPKTLRLEDCRVVA